MSGMWNEERPFAEGVAALAYCNPFLPRRVELERAALGSDFEAHGETWNPIAGSISSPNVAKIQDRLGARIPVWRDRLLTGSTTKAGDLALYRDVVYYALYNHYAEELLELIKAEGSTVRMPNWETFLEDLETFLPAEIEVQGRVPPDLLLAWFFQLRRAFHHIFRSIYGSSLPVAELRAQVWQSVFTHDMRRYQSGLYERMRETTTLITGPSGTGKELVARGIALSQYIPFDSRRKVFKADFRDAFRALNLSALSPTLIESELFGHRKGAFTGALDDRRGWLEGCPAHGTVFLDEIGDVSEEIQVKLLRVLQTRAFQRLGDTEDRSFEGKLVAATNREPEAEMEAGRMRTDFYYRICADQVRTPSLQQQLDRSGKELTLLLQVIVSDLVGPENAESLTHEVADWVVTHLGHDYPWPGNFRELEQCARNVMIRGSYRPAHPATLTPSLASEISELSLDAETLLRRYATLAYHRTGSYVGAADKIGLDRRTIKAKVDPEYLAALRSA